jgi:hypothetical protein
MGSLWQPWHQGSTRCPKNYSWAGRRLKSLALAGVCSQCILTLRNTNKRRETQGKRGHSKMLEAWVLQLAGNYLSPLTRRWVHFPFDWYSQLDASLWLACWHFHAANLAMVLAGGGGGSYSSNCSSSAGTSNPRLREKSCAKCISSHSNLLVHISCPHFRVLSNNSVAGGPLNLRVH